MQTRRTHNHVQYWQLRRRLSVEQAAFRLGRSPARYRVVVVLGTERFTDAELRQAQRITGMGEETLRVWRQRPRGDTRNPQAR